MKWISLILFCCLFVAGYSQETEELKSKFEINGYVKNLESISFDKTLKNNISNNLFHNRINSKWRPSKKITVVSEIRNRLFWGEEVKLTPDFTEKLRNDNEFINLQKVWIRNNSLVLHTNIERLNFEYNETKWNLKIGRQRINWGMTTIWNPNDIFNTYNFLDFDYEERPGIDGARFQYFINNLSNLEIAYGHSMAGNRKTGVLKYSINKWGYDLQVNSGLYNEHLTIGVGWAGSINEAGFKGEAQYFFKNIEDNSHFNLSLEADYMFAKGWYANAGFLYNNNGLHKPVNNWTSINLKLSPENLMPTKWNFITSTSKQITPLFSINASILYAPGTNLLLLLPSARYNLAANLDADIVWQSFFTKLNDNFEAVAHLGFFRLKWSF